MESSAAYFWRCDSGLRYLISRLGFRKVSLVQNVPHLSMFYVTILILISKSDLIASNVF